MLINVMEENNEKHVEFISYDGKWPTLCMGILTLKIDGKIVTFGLKTKPFFSSDKGPFADYPLFWHSGGSSDYRTGEISEGEWIIDYKEIPDKFKKYAAEIDKIFNYNVPQGCCGGCI